MNFRDLNLIDPLLRAVTDAGYQTPTPIQKATIPLVVSGRDVLGCAQTGTGKTAAFALPILQRLAAKPAGGGKDRPIRALIVTPTRELALQIHESFETYGKNLPLRCCVIFGGVKQGAQVDQLLRRPDILVATPGRLNDLIGQGFIKLERLEVFVLDEADRMLDMGFIHDIRKLLRCLPQRRQTLFFSATMPPEVETLAMTLLHQPESVKVDPVTSTVDSINQYLYYVDKANKSRLLAGLLAAPEVKSALVFTRTKHGADKVVRELTKSGVQTMAIHGNKSQNARQAALRSFLSGEIRVLIATDIAARGIDVPELSHVFNYNVPMEPETYIHRIGRTGRAGLGGDAVTFCCCDEVEQLAAVQKLIGRKIPVLKSPYPMVVTAAEAEAARQEAAARQGPRGGRRAGTAPRPAGDPPRRAVRQEDAPARRQKDGAAAPRPAEGDARRQDARTEQTQTGTARRRRAGRGR